MRYEQRFSTIKDFGRTKFFCYEVKDNSRFSPAWTPREISFQELVTKEEEGVQINAYLRNKECVVIHAGEILVFGEDARKAYNHFFNN